ncbi:hypothetical protein V5049_15565 [Moellerella wisconsensis]|uniref:hypothetical protein n=1 Tax=Moellerella wisconsensis TaxID=158849 RepID=UPI0030761099
MDKLRQQFEDYILNNPNAHIDPLKMSRFGYYYYHVTREAWEAWQASSESLINNLEPIGYMESNGVDYINKHGFTHINAEQSGSINIPLYKLD